jgi:hypothetical protein
MGEKGSRQPSSYKLENVRILHNFFVKCIQELPKCVYTFPEIIVAMHTAVDEVCFKTIRDKHET